MAKKAKKPSGPTPVESITHDDDRTNIPTRELESFATGTEPETLLYDRDPSLDPQLVWKGKDHQDRAPLEVVAPPIYIQEKIDPRVIIENLRRTAERPEDEPELTLFDAYDGDLSFDEKVEFYTHADRWKNRLILGDSLAVMASLNEKEDLKSKVQTIYMDPPYGIKFGSNWQVSTRKRDVKDGKAEDATREPEQIKAYRDTWELGIHSYLTYLRDRFTVARDLLTESGSIFVQIGDENVHLVRSVLDEVFGAENFVSLVTFKKTSGASSNELAGVVDYLIWYANSRADMKYRPVFAEKRVDGPGGGQYTWVQTADGERHRRTAAIADGLDLADARAFRTDNLTSQRPAQAGDLTSFEYDGDVFTPGAGTFKSDFDGLSRLAVADRLMAVGRTLTYVRFLDDFPALPFTNLWDDTVTSGFGDPKVYVVQTNLKVTQRCLLMTTDPGDLVLDPTCGSGTTAVVAEQWGRRWITCDTSRVALALARTRIMAARYPYYVLSDSDDGAKKDAKETGTAPDPGPYKGDIRRGFAYKRVPHITLKSIAQNPDIEEGMSREEIDEAIRRHADLEVLYDQPHEDRKKVRVAGPFTVESLSPHRTIATDDPDGPTASPTSEQDADRSGEAHNLEGSILENLRKAGVQNTVKDERLEFETLTAHPGSYVQALGTHRVAGGDLERVAVAIGPEHGTVGPKLLREAAKEAMRGVGVDLLLVCGFAFDAHSSETAAELNDGSDAWATTAGEQSVGALRVVLVKMNPDLAMGDDLLKKTGSGNLFMVFGEPDIEIRNALLDGPMDGDFGEKLVVKLNGLDVYDPTTGQVRSHTTHDIACWFIDTDYDSESFFVRHAYFTGADEPYEKLSKALKADIDPDAWATLYSTESRPFDPPSTGRIAVKVINHYGDEVLKVYDVEAGR